MKEDAGREVVNVIVRRRRHIWGRRHDWWSKSSCSSGTSSKPCFGAKLKWKPSSHHLDHVMSSRNFFPFHAFISPGSRYMLYGPNISYCLPYIAPNIGLLSLLSFPLLPIQFQNLTVTSFTNFKYLETKIIQIFNSYITYRGGSTIRSSCTSLLLYPLQNFIFCVLKHIKSVKLITHRFLN